MAKPCALIIMWSGDEEASLGHFGGEEDFDFVSRECVVFFCGSWSHPVLEVWWAVSLCGIQPAKIGSRDPRTVVEL